MRVLEPGVDIIVVNYQTPEDLQGFLDSLNVQIEHDIWIGNVSPTSTDSGVMYDYAARHGNVHPYEWEENVGYAKAVNEMAQHGNREVLAIFNADVRVSPMGIEQCHDALMASDLWGVLGPHQVDETGRVTHAGIFGTNTEPKFRAWRSHSSDGLDDVQEAVTVMGSAYFVWRTLWEDLARCDGCNGAFLPTPLYYEETWCSYHARAHGYKVMYYGPVKMTHRYHQAISKNEAWANEQRKISQQMFRDACANHGIECD